jgi:hypothetical protein
MMMVCSGQGLGEEPGRVLAGTWSSRARIGSICLLDSKRKGVSFAEFPGPVAALTATDCIVVAGFSGGGIKTMRMDTSLR